MVVVVMVGGKAGERREGGEGRGGEGAGPGAN